SVRAEVLPGAPEDPIGIPLPDWIKESDKGLPSGSQEAGLNVKSAIQLKELLDDTSEMKSIDQKPQLVAGIGEISGERSNSSQARSEALMRDVLGWGYKIVKHIDSEVDVQQPGVIDEDVAVLRRSIGFARDYKDYSSSATQGRSLPPYAQFG